MELQWSVMLQFLGGLLRCIVSKMVGIEYIRVLFLNEILEKHGGTG